jgi:type II secretion system protein G
MLVRIARRIRGFTLIELLIVVAIIAILAAIAVPNFLEAQFRSKVSRVKGDLRSVAIAVEAYRTDNSTYPGDSYDWQDWGLPPSDPRTQWPWVQVALTTPVAYMTSIPIDPFVEVTYPGALWSWYLTKTGYYRRHGTDGGTGFFATSPREKTDWCLVSPGPDNFWEFDRNERDIPYAIGKTWPSGQGDVIYYDASNGTISMGDIFYYGSGLGLDPQPPPTKN